MVWRTVMTLFIVCTLPHAAAAAEFGTSRPGADYRIFDLPRPDYTLCESGCMADGACRAWTYVRPATAGQKARCRLKADAARATRASCCISGVRPAADTTTVVGKVQRQLAVLGYDPGPVDGRAGSSTRDAVMRFQADHRLPIHGQITSGLITVLAVALRERRARARGSRPTLGPVRPTGLDSLD